MSADIRALSGGEILVSGPAVLWMAKQAAAGAAQLRRDGVRGSLVEEWSDVLDVAARRTMSSALGNAEVPQSQAVPASRVIDPIDVREASMILKCSTRNVRYLCGRGALGDSANCDAGYWRIERADVIARASRATS